MYLGKKKIFNPEQYERDRLRNIETKDGATWLAFLELDGLLNKTQLAQQYFGKSHAWLSQKLNGCTSHNRKQEFTEAEYAELAESFRHIARRLMAHAEEIEAAAM